jgi:hypothetical protein
LLSAPAAQVTLLLREPGRLVVTRGRLYFQPLHNLNADTPVRSRPLSAIAAVARRRHQLRHVAMEVFFMEPDARAAGGWEVRPCILRLNRTDADSNPHYHIRGPASSSPFTRRPPGMRR